MKATVDEIIRRAGGSRNSGVTRNQILNNTVPAVLTKNSTAVTVTTVANEGERAGCLLTRELKGWQPVDNFTLP